MPATPSSGYHHGDLPAAIMALAIEEIARQGTERLSLRALARRAGVSQAAPYHHFGSRTGLLAALAQRGFEELRDNLVAAQEGLDDPGAALLEMGVAYVAFAEANPVVYEIMLGQSFADFSNQDQLHAAAHGCIRELERCMKRFSKANGLTVNPRRYTGVLWAAAHGIASLQTSGEGTAAGAIKLRIRDAIAKDIRGALQMLLGGMLR